MATVRCGKHDVVFETKTDHRSPGSSEMPDNCHPDCPKPGPGETTAVSAPSSGRVVFARG